MTGEPRPPGRASAELGETTRSMGSLADFVRCGRHGRRRGGPGETDQVGEVESVAETDSELGDGNVVCTTVYRAMKAKPGVVGVGEHWQVPGGEKREGLYVKLRLALVPGVLARRHCVGAYVPGPCSAT